LAGKSSRHILIIGGGIAGPALALFLQKSAISCAVYEAYPYSEGVRGGLNIASNGMNVFSALGLAESLAAKGTPTYASIFQNELGWTLARIPYGNPQEFHQPCICLSRAAVVESLALELKGNDIDIHYEKRLAFVTETENSVTAHFEDGTTATGDLLIGADGIHSAVRNHILPDGPKPEDIGVTAIGGFVPLVALPEIPKQDLQAATYTFGPKGSFGWSGCDAGTVAWWRIFRNEKESAKPGRTELDWAALKTEMLATYRGYPKPIEAVIENTTSLLRINICDILALPTWHKGRITLVGDAAHATSPYSGQGASIALEDAMYLAKLLRDLENHDYVFNQFQAHRKERVEKIVAEGRERSIEDPRCNDHDLCWPPRGK
jgi:2-polyprenyl-6-methoxyphenol hydroxylase-like FAD-dependent oxidoreductase